MKATALLLLWAAGGDVDNWLTDWSLFLSCESMWSGDCWLTNCRNLKSIRNKIGYDYTGNLLSYLCTNINNSILEIGAGEGAVARFLKSKNFNIDLVEPDANYKKSLKKSFDTVYSNINSCKKKYDIIYSIGVLEHIYDMEKFILQCKKLLNKDGLLIFQYPNITSLSSKLCLKKWDMLFEPGHLSIPSVKGFKMYLKKNDLRLDKSFSATILTRGRVPFVPCRNYNVELIYKKLTHLKLFSRLNRYLWKLLDFFNLGETVVVIIKKK